MGVDYGLSRIGLAISVGIAPRLIPRLDERDATRAARGVAKVAREHLAEEIVLGLPLNSAGEQGEQAKVTIIFAKLVCEEAPHLPLLLLDERFTSAQADYMLASVKPEERAFLRDSVSAACLLQRYFADGGGEVKPYLFHTPIIRRREGRGETREVPSYREWRAQRMKRAQEDAATMRKKKKGKQS